MEESSFSYRPVQTVKQGSRIFILPRAELMSQHCADDVSDLPEIC